MLFKYCIDGYKFILVGSGNFTQVYEIQNNKSLPAKCEKVYRKAPNGKIIEFPKDTSEKEIKEYLALPEYQIKLPAISNLKLNGFNVAFLGSGISKFNLSPLDTL